MKIRRFDQVIVVSGDRHQIKFLDAVDTSPWVRAVTNRVSQAPDHIEPAPVLGVR